MENKEFVFFLYDYVLRHVRKHNIPIDFGSSEKDKDQQYALCVALFKESNSFEEYVNSKNLDEYLRIREFLLANKYPLINMNRVKLQFRLRKKK